MTNRNSTRRGRISTGAPSNFELAFDVDTRAAKLFDVLLDLGRTTVQRLAHAAKTERTGTYDVLNRLVARGLVATHPLGARTLYEVVNPETIRQQSVASLERIDALMPDLRARYAKHSSAPMVRSVSGEKAWQALLDRIDTDGTSDLLILAPSLAFTDVFGAFPAVTNTSGSPSGLMIGDKKSSSPNVRLLVGASSVAAGWRWLNQFANRVIVRQLQPATTVMVGEVLFDQAVAYVLTEGDAAVSFLESMSVTSQQRQLFELAWRSAKPLAD